MGVAEDAPVFRTPRPPGGSQCPSPHRQSPARNRSGLSPLEVPPPGPDNAPPKPAEEGGLFRLLVESGCDPTVAYTAEKRIHTVSSGIADDRLLPVLAELRQLRENMATKADLASMEARMVKWMFGALMAQGALLVAVIKLTG